MDLEGLKGISRDFKGFERSFGVLRIFRDYKLFLGILRDFEGF